jgi:hypothetical protein
MWALSDKQGGMQSHGPWCGPNQDYPLLCSAGQAAVPHPFRVAKSHVDSSRDLPE